MTEAKALDQNFKNTVAAYPGGERVLNCFLCGTCTAGCPISEIDKEYNPRNTMRKILLGMKDDVLGSGDIWKCYQCHTCVAHCPQDVRFADIVRVLREISVDEGLYDEKFAETVEEADLHSRKQRLEKVQSLIDKK